MMLSKKTKYAINALVYIAKHPEDQPIPTRIIAEKQNIPLKFLEAILVELKNARIVNSKKGKYGGYSLNRPTDEIDIAEVTRLFDGSIALLPCVTSRFYEPCEECIDEATCGIRQVFSEIRLETLKRMESATLADIMKREEHLRQK